MAASPRTRRPAGRGLATVLALFTLALGLGLLALAVDDDLAPEAVVIDGTLATVVVGGAGLVHALLGARAVVRLFGGRWGAYAARPVERSDVRRLRLVGGLDVLTGLGLLLVAVVNDVGSAVQVREWASTVATAVGVVLVVLGAGLLALSLRPVRGELPPGVTGTSWRHR